jgi:MFS family permease
VDRRPASPLSVLVQHRDFRRLFAGNSVSLLGSSVTGVALPLTAVVYLHASPAEMGLLGAVALVPYLVLSLPAGVWVDRMPYRRLLVSADLAQAGLLGSIPVLAAFGVLELWQLYIVAVLAGAVGLFEAVAAQSFIPRLVSRQQLVPANSALMLSTAAVGTTGSALGGILVSLLTAPLAIATDAVSFLVAAVCKARIQTPGLSAVPERAERRHLRGDIADGLRAVFGHPVVRPAMTAATVGAFGGQVQGVVLILFLVRDAGLPPALVGVIIAVGGVAAVAGAALATPLTARLGPGPAFITGMLIASVAGIVLACAFPPLPLALTVLVAAQLLRGAGPPLYSVNQQTFRQALLDPGVLSRANASWRFLVYGTQVFGALLGGLIGSVLGLRAALLISSAIMLAGVAIAWSSPLRSLRELPAEPATGEGASGEAAAA